MQLSVRGRAVAVLGLLTLLVVLAVWYGSLGPSPAFGAYPGQDELANNYQNYLGAQVTLGGRVVATNPVVILANTGPGTAIRLTVTDLSTPVTTGTKLRVYGVAEADHTIRAINAFSVPRSGHWYAWTISFVAGLWVLTRLIRYWRFNPTDYTLVRRATPLALPHAGRIPTIGQRQEEDDA